MQMIIIDNTSPTNFLHQVFFIFHFFVFYNIRMNSTWTLKCKIISSYPMAYNKKIKFIFLLNYTYSYIFAHVILDRI